MWFAIVAFLGFVAIWPVWSYFSGAYTGAMPDYLRFLVGLVPPATVALFLASWAQPGGT